MYGGKAFEKNQGSLAVIGNSKAKLQALFFPIYCKQLGLTRVMLPILMENCLENSKT
jgi:hypothetical protein